MDLLSEFFRHNTMMNQRLVATCKDLTAEQLDATVQGTYGNIAATLVHVANAQESYAARLLDIERPERLSDDPFPGFEALSARFEQGNAQLEQAASGADQDRIVHVTGDDPPSTWRMPVGLILVQAINHGTEHRSQIATILSQLGVEPPNMDGWTFFDASGHMILV